MEQTTTALPTLNEILTAEVREQILANKDQFIDALNEALNPLGVKYIFGKSVSFCVKQSDAYNALPKAQQTSFMNKVRSILKAHHVGEQMTLEAIARGFWAQFNGSLVDKDKNGVERVKKLNVSFIRGDVKASREDENVLAKIENDRNAVENAKTQKALAYFKSKYNVSDAELASAISVAGSVVE